jgi:serine/threonine protein kinase
MASRLREVFDAAAERDPADREAFLDHACAGDPALRAEVERMLLANSSTAPAWFEQPLQASLGSMEGVAVPASLEGRQIGPYRLRRQLGSGGMGTVYLAERSIGKLNQQVALKIVRAGLAANAEIIRRFEQEREILASLDHPNIARLLDIGSTADGIPYLVMDYVAGEPVDVYCDTRKLSIPERLALFRSACAAIQYAHSRGVVHRDLKPSNMLVTPEGTLKLLDFGIAKVLNSEGQTTLVTASGTMLMTIEYASPEQICGGDIGPRSDVYSLGVVLYELLTGCRPYRTHGRLPHVIARAICEEAPVTPSSAVAEPPGAVDLEEIADRRAEKPYRLRRRLSGDLDSIVLKALRKKPDWRYESPAELSEDIRRHIDGFRVAARKDTLRYRAEKAFQRILYPAEGVFHSHGMLMLTAGILGSLLMAERQIIAWRWKPSANGIADTIAVGVWLVWSMQEGRRMIRAGKFSPLDRQSWIVFTVITVALGLLTIMSGLRQLLTPDAMAIFWNTGLAIGLIIVGLQASRLMTAGGIALMASAIVAGFYPGSSYACLAGGILAGMVLPGVILIIQTKGSRDVPVGSDGDTVFRRIKQGSARPR